MRWLAALAMLLAASPAAANYVFDPADLPSGFKCDTDSEAEPCEEQRRFEAWWNRFDDRYTLWHDRMLFDPDSFFGEARALSDDPDGEAEPEKNFATPNLVDATYRIALRRYGDGWTFAIDMVCASGPDNSEACTPKLRMVSFRKRDEIPADIRERLKDHLPTSPTEAAFEFRAAAKWEEADLRTCPGALRQLLRFSAQRGDSFWDPGYVRWLKGGTVARPETIIVTADGSGVRVRARGMRDPATERPAVDGGYAIYSQWNGGEGMAWAVDMAEVVKPCLKPAAGPAPWDKVLAAASKGK